LPQHRPNMSFWALLRKSCPDLSSTPNILFMEHCSWNAAAPSAVYACKDGIVLYSAENALTSQSLHGSSSFSEDGARSCTEPHVLARIARAEHHYPLYDTSESSHLPAGFGAVANAEAQPALISPRQYSTLVLQKHSLLGRHVDALKRSTIDNLEGSQAPAEAARALHSRAQQHGVVQCLLLLGSVGVRVGRYSCSSVGICAAAV
jgi:hypothetical protein